MCLPLIHNIRLCFITDRAFSMTGPARELEEPLIALLGTYVRRPATRRQPPLASHSVVTASCPSELEE